MYKVTVNADCLPPCSLKQNFKLDNLKILPYNTKCKEKGEIK